MSKYKPLYRWLQEKAAKDVAASFTELEAVLGFDLPPTATKDSAWWANETGESRHVQCRAWLDAGFETRDVNLIKKSIRFVREGAPGRA
jgi:hypothetical protein